MSTSYSYAFKICTHNLTFLLECKRMNTSSRRVVYVSYWYENQMCIVQEDMTLNTWTNYLNLSFWFLFEFKTMDTELMKGYLRISSKWESSSRSSCIYDFENMHTIFFILIFLLLKNEYLTQKGCLRITLKWELG